jgi:hypothetical protein
MTIRKKRQPSSGSKAKPTSRASARTSGSTPKRRRSTVAWWEELAAAGRSIPNEEWTKAGVPRDAAARVDEYLESFCPHGTNP